MTVRTLYAAALGTCLSAALTGTGSGQEPTAPEPSRLRLAPVAAAPTNQALADAVAARLRQAGTLKGYAIEIRVEAGIAELTGRVRGTAQRDEAIRLARGVPGVRDVRARLETGGAGAIVTAQAPVVPAAPPAAAPAAPPGAGLPPGVSLPPGVTLPPGATFQPPPGAVVQPPPGGVPPAVSGAPWVAPQPGHTPGAPVPIYQAPPGPNPNLQKPPLPPYAWPTFAPYNNYSRVAYPTMYPYETWPFIGPFYPFPRVPLGWRSVSLTWADGHWWYGKNATGHDWWRIRYW